MKKLLTLSTIVLLAACGESAGDAFAPDGPQDDLRAPVGDPVGVPTTSAGARIFTFSGPTQAVAGDVVQTIGAGTAVTSVDAAADFEDTGSLYGNPYVEDGLAFSRTSLSFNNNGCGYAGCGYHLGFYPGFTGNYLYGTGYGGYFTIATADGENFTGLEFLSGSGCSWSPENITWSAHRDGVQVDQGSLTVGQHAIPVLGFSSDDGFDELRYTRYCSWGYPAPALDQVRAQIGPGDPETKDDCKKGGWEQYGFRNQGQCVRFVETGKDSRG